MGISSISSYRGSQLFEIVGLGEDIVDLCFTNSISRIGGKNFNDLDAENKKLTEYAKSNLSDISVGGLLNMFMEENIIHIILKLLKNFKKQSQVDQVKYIMSMLT